MTLSELTILKNRIKVEYTDASLITQVCRLEEKSDGKKADFEWITNTVNLPKANLIADNVVTNPIVNNFLISETNYILDNIRNNSTIVALEGDELSSIRRYTVEHFVEQEIQTIIIPRELWIRVPNWNREINPNLTENLQGILHLGYPKSVRVIIPPNGVDFNDIIITSRVCNHLQFIPSKDEDKHRLHAGHEFRGTNIAFYLHAWYKYEKSALNCNVTIRRN